MNNVGIRLFCHFLLCFLAFNGRLFDLAQGKTIVFQLTVIDVQRHHPHLTRHIDIIAIELGQLAWFCNDTLPLAAIQSAAIGIDDQTGNRLIANQIALWPYCLPVTLQICRSRRLHRTLITIDLCAATQRQSGNQHPVFHFLIPKIRSMAATL
ncbi:Hypothetical Protein PANA_2287 [Pantoea ananatis LMG 20103]|uniref:Uncharacterized protein n=1 Tax=Pantoea ananatis (strain LMG 20103) TaxID=706191 RepID=D4GH07_PANAM|nr:Hypothetical Protein PANA_2287 [Pantoea ananatis LMG 20103]